MLQNPGPQCQVKVSYCCKKPKNPDLFAIFYVWFCVLIVLLFRVPIYIIQPLLTLVSCRLSCFCRWNTCGIPARCLLRRITLCETGTARRGSRNTSSIPCCVPRGRKSLHRRVLYFSPYDTLSWARQRLGISCVVPTNSCCSRQALFHLWTPTTSTCRWCRRTG